MRLPYMVIEGAPWKEDQMGSQPRIRVSVTQERAFKAHMRNFMTSLSFLHHMSLFCPTIRSKNFSHFIEGSISFYLTSVGNGGESHLPS